MYRYPAIPKKDTDMKKLYELWKLELVLTASIIRSRGTQVKTITLMICAIWLTSCFTVNPNQEKKVQNKVTSDITELKQIGKSEGPQRVLISNNIRCISADDKNVWIATDRGVSRLDRSTNCWRYYTKDDGLNSDNINAVASDLNWVWFGTDDGVNQYNIDTGTWRSFKAKDGLKGNRVFRIATGMDYTWFGTNRGINRYTRSIDSWSARMPKDGLSNNNVSAIALEDDYVWIGTHYCVNKYSKTTDSWNTYSTSNGLAENFVTTIAVSGNYVWFGTNGSGISVYNKTNQTFGQQYTKSDVLSSNDIRSIAVDGNNIWIGTTNGGVHRYIEAVGTWVRYTKDDGLVSDNISWITAYKSEIWFGTYDSGVSMYDKVRNRWVTYLKADSPPEDEVKAIARNESGKFWIATSGGLMKYDPIISEWTRYGKKDGLSTEYITSLTMDGDILWIGTSRGLASYDERTGHWQFYNGTNGLSENFVTSLAIIDEGSSSKAIWVGTNRGLFRGKIGKGLLTKAYESIEGFSDYAITSITQGDHEIWIGTDKGLLEYDVSTGKRSLYTNEHGLVHNHVNCMLVQKDQIWIGTRGGVAIHELDTGAWRTILEGLPNPNVRSLMNDPERNCIWIGTTGGLVRSFTNISQLEVTKLPYSITSIARFADDVLLLGTTSGTMEYNISSGEHQEHRAFVTRQPLKEASVANIVFDGDAIWFSNWSASHNGAIIRYDRKSDTWRRFTRETILGNTKDKSPTIIKQICVDNKWVWFATDYGVLQYDKGADIWRHFTTEDGLLSNNIRQIECTTNVVWVCPEMKTRINKYDKRDGMWNEVKLSHLIHPRNYVYDMQADGDTLWLSISSSGVRRISEDGKQTVFMGKDGLAQMGARCIGVDEDYVWVAHWKDRGSGTLSRYDKKTGKWTVYSSSDVLEGDMIAKIVKGEEYTWFIYELWRKGSVTGYNRKTGEWTTIQIVGWGSQIREVCEDEGYLWLAPEMDGIRRFHIASGTWISFHSGEGPLMDFVNQMAFKADSKYLWIGTPGGISRYDKERESWTNYTRQNTLVGENIQAVTSDDRCIWCGTSQGISRYDKLYGTWTNHRLPIGGSVSDDITGLAVDNRFLWVTSRRGAGRYDKIADRWDSYGDWNGLPGMDVSCLAIDGYDIWMGTNGGMGKFPCMSDNRNAWVSYTSGLEIKAGTMTKEYANTLVSNEVWSVAASKDYIWVGTMRGVSRYSKGSDTWMTYTTENGLVSNEISSICVDGNVIWFGSDSGITMYDKGTDKWVTYTTDNGLASNRITCIARGPDTVWFGTFDAGLMKYDKKTGTWLAYSRKDGLAHDCVLSISVNGGCIWVGTRRGLSRYDVNTNNWTTYTQYGDSEDELDMVAQQVKKSVKQNYTESEVSRPVKRNVEIAEINYDPSGRDEENLNGEWVKIANTTDAPVDITGFTLSDNAGNTYKFGELVLLGHSTITVYTGSGTNTPSYFYWGSKTPIWNNKGDKAYLKNTDGKLIDIYSYSLREAK
jgi:ligand-binding sensor domain-containing protein